MNSWIVQGLDIFALLFVFSCCYAAAMWYLVLKKIRKHPQHPGLFWIERWIGKGKNGYLLFSLMLPLLVISLDYAPRLVRHEQISLLDVLLYCLFYVGSSVALWLLRKVYQIFLEVLPNMVARISACPDEIPILHRIVLRKARLENNLRGFVIAAGSDPRFSIMNIITASIIFTVFSYTFSADGIQYFPLALFVSLLAGGMVGPMATISMFFVSFCSLLFRGPQFYNLCAPDRCGGFKRLGDLISLSDSMAFVAAIGSPVAVLIRVSTGSRELSLNVGITIFIAVCISSFYVIPLLFLHSSMKSGLEAHRKKLYQEICESSRSILDRNPSKVENGHFLTYCARKQLFSFATEASDWPADYITSSKIVFGALTFIGTHSFGGLLLLLLTYLESLFAKG